MEPIDTVAGHFYHAFYRKEWLGGSDHDLCNLSIAEAYEIQDLVAEKRIESGESIAGYKVGCTSEAIRSQFGLTEPICGRLFRPHILEEGVSIDRTSYANCAIEPEMILKIGTDLGKAEMSDKDLIDGIEFVSPGIEIHNYTFWQGQPTLQELICSGGIHAGLVVGKTKVSPNELRFGDEMFSVYKDNIRVTSEPATKIMEGPLHSLRWLVNFLTARGDYLKKGSLVIPGSPTELVTIDQDTEVKIEIEKVGKVVAAFSA